MRLPPSSTLFPYTTLFRSCPGQPGGRLCDCPGNAPAEIGARTTKSECDGIECGSGRSRRIWGTHDELPAYARRSEEHTSELQSRGHLVCRLLLEKKKHKIE